jgi:hypothetical protein
MNLENKISIYSVYYFKWLECNAFGLLLLFLNRIKSPECKTILESVIPKWYAIVR